MKRKPRKNHGIDTKMLVDLALPLKEGFTRQQQNEFADILAEMAKAIGMSEREISDEVISAAGGPPINLGN